MKMIAGSALVLAVMLAACRQPMAESPLIHHLDSGEFADTVEQSQGLALVDFWAPWCGPCRAIAPGLVKLAGEFEGNIRFYKVNVDDNQALAGRFQIRGIPTLILFRDGKAADMVVGARSEAEFREWLQTHVEKTGT